MKERGRRGPGQEDFHTVTGLHDTWTRPPSSGRGGGGVQEGCENNNSAQKSGFNPNAAPKPQKRKISKNNQLRPQPPPPAPPPGRTIQPTSSVTLQI